MIKVVIAEDERLIMEELISMIPWEAYGLTLCGQAADGFEALEQIRRTDADILITDIRMPGKDGLSVIEEASAERAIKCIIISGYDQFEYALQALRLGVVNFLLKPVDETMLLQTLRDLIQALGHEEESGQRQTDPLGGQPVNNRYLKEILKYIDENYMRNITIRTLSETFYISEGYISKLFPKYMGQHFVEYLNCYRIMKAMELLRTTNKKIYEISSVVGYKDYRYFSMIFKKLTGKTPVEYKHMSI